MDRIKIVEKLGAKIYLELGPRIGDLNTARKLADLLLTDAETYGVVIPQEKKSKKEKK